MFIVCIDFCFHDFQLFDDHSIPYAAGRMSFSNLVQIAMPPLPPLAIKDFSLEPMIVNAGILDPFLPEKSAGFFLSRYKLRHFV